MTQIDGFVDLFGFVFHENLIGFDLLIIIRSAGAMTKKNPIMSHRNTFSPSR